MKPENIFEIPAYLAQPMLGTVLESLLLSIFYNIEFIYAYTHF